MTADSSNASFLGDRLDYFHPDVVEKFEAGVAEHQQGNLDGAEIIYKEILQMTVDHPGALNLVGVLNHQKGDHETAIDCLEKAIGIAPENPDFHSNLGAAYFGSGNLEAAESSFRRALYYDDRNAGANGNLTSILLEKNLFEEALPFARKAAELDPNNYKYRKRFGDISLHLDMLEEAVEIFLGCIEMQPDDAEIVNNLGYTYERLGNLEKTEEYYRRAHELRPDTPEITNNLASALGNLGRHEEAQKYYQEALNAPEGNWTDISKMASTYLNAGDHERAITLFEKGIKSAPEDPELFASYGAALTAMGRLDDADAAYRKSLKIRPNAPEVWNNLGNNSSRRYQLLDAVDEFKKAIELSAYYPEPHINLCLTLMFLGKLDEAYMYAHISQNLPRVRGDSFANPLKIFRGVCDFDGLDELGNVFELVEKFKNADIAACFLAMLPECSEPENIQRLVDFHFHWGKDLVKTGTSDLPLPPRGPRDRNSKLKIGFLSSDLREHSVAKFVLPILRHYDRDQFEIHCFTPAEAVGDKKQTLVKELIDGFHVTENMNLRGAASYIRDQNIDVAFDLNGFTRDTMIKSLAFKPAPVQVYWLGYPFTTGLPEMDHILVDKYFAPENLDWLIEEPLYMPDAWVCFDSFPEVPISDKLPVERSGKLTFGSLNNPYKFTREAIMVWATIMNQFEDSEFLLVRPEADSVILQGKLSEHFANAGVSPDRLKFINNRKMSHPHFAYYDLIDISLDTFPQTGGTTTCDSLWMGVPVISLVGPSMHQRVSYSLLENAGVGELCCFSLEEYMEKAVMLGNDIASLRDYRHKLRPALLESPLCQAEQFTGNFQKVIVDAFEKSGA